METIENNIEGRNRFQLNKWFLDCVSETGEAVIFYAAHMQWHGFQIPYTSWLHSKPRNGTTVKSRMHGISVPEKADRSIHWQDSRFGVSGVWEQIAPALKARLFDSDDGYLDWNCYQPLSRVNLQYKDRTVEGLGYAEQLVMTVEPWKISMHELRWGRYGSEKDNLVWIELKGVERRQWLWYNGERIGSATIADDKLTIPEKDLTLELDQAFVLESEKKIFNVVRSLLHFIPGFSKSMPSRFLMSDESKWCSRGCLRKEGEVVSTGWAIHECVNFNNQGE